MNWEDNLHIPSHAKLSRPSADLIKSLLTHATKRLGSASVDDIKRHSFFKEISFDGLRQTVAPFVPKIKYAEDTSNFDCEEHNISSMDNSQQGTLENGKYPQHAFFEFTFKRFFDEGGQPIPMKHLNPDDDSSPVYV